MLTELSNKLKTWFFQAPRKLLDGPKGPKELPGSNREVLWIVPRSELVHRVFDFPAAVLDANKDAALKLQLSGWAPFESAKFAVHWVGARASVFAWDGPRQDARKAAALGPSQRVTFVPAPFIEEPMNRGSRLLQHEFGFEAQHWSEGSIAASRWWPRKPDDQALVHFYRAAKAEPGHMEAVETTVLDRPWHQTPSLMDQAAVVAGDGHVLRYAGLAALAVFAALIGQYLVLTAGEVALRQSLSSDQTYFAELRQERRNAILSRQEVAALSQLGDRKPQVVLYDEVLQVLGPRPVRLLIWTYVPTRLTLTLRSDEPVDPTDFINEFESSPHFENVVATTVGRDQDLRIEMTVTLPIGGAGA